MKMLADLGRDGRLWKQRAAIIDAASGLRVSYGDLAQSIHGFGLFLDAQGIQPGARVTILSHSSFQMCMAVLACLGNGVVANPLNPGLPEDLKSAFITHGQPSLVLTDDLEVYERIQHGLSSGAVDWVYIGRGYGRDIDEADGTRRGATGTSEVFIRALMQAWLDYMTRYA